MFGNVLPGALQQQPVELQSAGQLGVDRTREFVFTTERISLVTGVHHHGSGKNTGEDERGYLQQVQQDAIHGRSLGAAAGKFGPAGNEVVK